jgi:hypothetical protein
VSTNAWEELARWHGLRRGLRWRGREFPVLCWAAGPAQWGDVESVLGALDESEPAGQELSAEFTGRRVFNGEVYAMDRLRVRPRLQLDLRRGLYFDSMNTSESLELEFRREVARGADWRKHLDKRRALGQRPWLDGRGRCAAVGVATLVAWRHDGGARLLLARLGDKAMPERAGLWHVAPAGMFSPPCSVRRLVQTELAEELPGFPAEAGRLYLAGVAVNLLNLRPEICTLLVLEGPAWLPALNAEYRGEACVVDYRSDAELLRELDLRAGTATPPGAAALYLGTRLLQTLKRATKLS